jgi:hypothetical protein
MRPPQFDFFRHPIAIAMLLIIPGITAAFQPKQTDTPLDQKQFYKAELYISKSSLSFEEAAKNDLLNRAEWERFFAKYGSEFHVYFDPRSETPMNIMGRIPMIPGSGVGNQLRLKDISRILGRRVRRMNSTLIGELILKFVLENKDLFGIDIDQLGPVNATQINDYLWHINIPQQVHDIPVRYGRLAAVINHGNLVLIGTETWGNVHLDTVGKISSTEAMKIGFDYAGGRLQRDRIWKEAALEIIPFATEESVPREGSSGLKGAGYGHRLAWVFGFQRTPELAQWEVLIDAHTGEVLAFQDKNAYIDKQIVGGAYALTNTEICPSNNRCGTMQPHTPMPWADTGLPPPDDFTNSAGIFNYTNGNVTTTLNGLYLTINDNCGAINETSATGDLNLGGINGQHDCTSSGTSPGDTSASRSCFYEVNKIAETARGYLPANGWLQNQLTANVNLNQLCNGFWDGATINFFKSGGGCRNTGENAAVFDHEWGHGLDDNDSGGNLSNSSEAYADIASMYRLWASCIGYGFFFPGGGNGAICGLTADGTGDNHNEAQVGDPHCDVDCSGVRDSDYLKHADQLPDGAINFVCDKCIAGMGPCGRQVHCSGTPVRQMAWDFAKRDLQSNPYNYDGNTAFIIADRIFYQGSGLIGDWHSCDCPNQLADGCAATNGYMQWLAIDDDDGDMTNGTPHMMALFSSYYRHGIACDQPAPQDSGCNGGPSSAPLLSIIEGNNENSLTWTNVPGAATYYVFRTEGYAGCDFGKALIANVNGTTYLDPDVASRRHYSYVVMGVGANTACLGPASPCVEGLGPALRYVSNAVTDHCGGGGPGDGDGILDPGESAIVQVTTQNIGTLTATGVSAVLTTTTPGITITNNTATFPDIAPQQIATSNPPHFSLVVASDVPCGTVILLTLVYTSNEGIWTDTFSLLVGPNPSTLLSEDFASGIPGTWTIIDGGSGGGTASTWTAANPGGRNIGQPFSDPFAIVDSDAAGFFATQDEQLITPLIDASGCSSVNLDFSNQFHWFQDSFDEIGDVDVSNDGGTTWNNVLSFQAGDSGYPIPQTKTVDISSFAAGQPNVKIRFHYYNANFEWWWAIDNVTVTCASSNCNICKFTCPSIILSPATLPDGTVGTNYNQMISATGGTAPYTFTVSSGTVPTGLTLTPAGLLSGTPTTTGTFNFAITATDINNCIGSLAYSVNINCPAIALSPPTLPDGSVGNNYNQTITASGGTAPYTFTVSSGVLPDGLTLSLTGLLSGTPTATGTFNFTITATDSNNCTGSQIYTIDINVCLFCDDFEDGVLPLWVYTPNSSFWSETNGSLIGSRTPRKTSTVASGIFAGCSNCSVSTAMRTTGGSGNRVWLLSWFVDKNNTIEVLMKEEQDKWVFKQRVNGKILTKAKASLTIDPNVIYQEQVAFDGTNFTLSVDGITILTVGNASSTTPFGTVGFRVKSTTALFDEIIVN